MQILRAKVAIAVQTAHGKNFKIYFLKNWSSDFIEILHACRGRHPLATKEVSRNSDEGKNNTTLGKIFEILTRRNSGPEVDIDKRSTVFFTVRRPLGDGVKSFRQGRCKWSKPTKCHAPKF